MKKFLQFAGLIGAVLAIVAFILMMACKALVYTSGSVELFVEGTTAIFGKTESTILGDVTTNPAATTLIAWILVLVAMLILLFVNILPLLKIKALDGIAGILNLVAVGALLLAGIFVFMTKGVFAAANDVNMDSYNLGVGYVFAGILAILGAAVAVLPVVMKLVSKK